MSLNSHDRCCWTCHLPIATIECQRCTRCHLSFHSKCALEQNVFNTRPHVVAGLDEDEKRVIIPLAFNTSDSTICSECKHREADNAFNTNFGFLKPTRENVHKSGIELFTCAVATLIKSCEKLSETFKHIDYDDKPKCAKYFHSKAKLDLSKMKEKAQNGYYRSTEEFMFDIKLIIHNQKVGNFYEQSIKVEDALEIEKNCDELERLARNEMDYLEMCDGCYWNYFGYYTPKKAALKKTAPQKATSPSAIQETDGNYHFTQPCGNPHGLIWTRMNEVKDAVVYQPAKVYGYRRPGTYELSQKKVWVIPFGYTTLGPKPAKVKDCWLYSKQPPPGSLRNKVLKIKYQKEFRRLHGFKKLAKAFIKNCRDNKGKVYRFVTDYHPPKSASRFKLDHLYMDVTFVEKLNKELPLEVNHNEQYKM